MASARPSVVRAPLPHRLAAQTIDWGGETRRRESEPVVVWQRSGGDEAGGGEQDEAKREK
jgi:hypothetical protein